jgi:eukaryotic translation initiation factor 2-alpha kinase 4
VDKRLYAIKKIPLDPHDKETNKKIRREVTTISRMIHKVISITIVIIIASS